MSWTASVAGTGAVIKIMQEGGALVPVLFQNGEGDFPPTDGGRKELKIHHPAVRKESAP